MDLIVKFWGSQLTMDGQTVIAFLVFNILFMLMGRFRFCFITSLGFMFYIVLFANRGMVESLMSNFSEMGFLAALIGSGILFIALSVWSFFIDSD